MRKTDNIVIDGLDGKPIICDLRYINDGEAKPLVIFCHGFKGFKDWGHFNLLADEIARNNMLVLKFNFSHNGGTMEDPIDFPDLEAFGQNNYWIEQNDLKAVLDSCFSGGIGNVLKDWNGEVFLIGHSRGGGAVVVTASKDDRVKKVVSWAGISDMMIRLPGPAELDHWKKEGVVYIKNGRTNQDMPMYYQFVEVLKAKESELNIQSACRATTIPHLIIHGTGDESVPYTQAEDMKRWNSNAKLSLIEGAGHTFGGKHPWDSMDLPGDSKKLVEETIQFLNSAK